MEAFVMRAHVASIHVFKAEQGQGRGWPGRARPWQFNRR